MFDKYSRYNIKDVHLFAKEANIGEATRSPTINAEDRTPSSKLFKSKSPLQATFYTKKPKNKHHTYENSSMLMWLHVAAASKLLRNNGSWHTATIHIHEAHICVHHFKRKVADLKMPNLLSTGNSQVEVTCI